MFRIRILFVSLGDKVMTLTPVRDSKDSLCSFMFMNDKIKYSLMIRDAAKEKLKRLINKLRRFFFFFWTLHLQNYPKSLFSSEI